MSEKLFGSMPFVMSALVHVGLIAAFAASVMLPSGGVTATIGAGDNGKTITIDEGSSLKISLDENPTTGFSWNESVTSGLTVIDSRYISSNSGLVGAGGVHEWTVEATGKGAQKFSAVYKRPWEPATGNETTFTIYVDVV
jgi:inhibitor of cysteine peptidase